MPSKIINVRMIQTLNCVVCLCSVLGIDLAPTPVEADKLPGNCQFEIDDVTLGLYHYYNSFHFIQARCIAGGVSAICPPCCHPEPLSRLPIIGN